MVVWKGFVYTFWIGVCLGGIQEVVAQSVVDVGFYGGLNFSRFDTKYDEYDNLLGGQGGFNVKVGTKWFQIEGALEYCYRGTKYRQDINVGSTTDNSYTTEYKSKIVSGGHHILIPLSFAVGYWNMTEDNEWEGAGLTVSGGGYIDIGVAGRTKAELSAIYSEGSASVQDYDYDPVSTKLFGDLPHQIKRFDVGWTVGVMFGAGSVFRLGVSYRHGLINLSNMDGYKIYNRSISLNLIIGMNFD